MNSASQKFLELIHLKQLLSHIDQAHRGIAATIGLLAFSGLNHIEQMPEMCRLLKMIFKLTTCGFFWADQAGNMLDAWCLTPELLSFETLTSCFEYQASGARTWPTFKENVLIGPMAGYLLPFQNKHFYASPYFHSTYHTIGVRHILDVVLHDGKRPFGVFLMMRSAHQGPFTPDERSLMVKLIPILNKAFSNLNPEATKYADREANGFALISQCGKNKSICEEARRTIWALSHTQPGSFADPKAPSIELYLDKLLDKHQEQIKAGERFSVDITNCWGRFNLAFEWEAKTLDTILKLRRKVPLPSQLAFAISKFNFPPMRQIVAWLLVQNISRNEIATVLDVSIETVTSHIKDIYKVTDVSSSHGLMLKLAG